MSRESGCWIERVVVVPRGWLLYREGGCCTERVVVVRTNDQLSTSLSIRVCLLFPCEFRNFCLVLVTPPPG